MKYVVAWFIGVAFSSAALADEAKEPVLQLYVGSGIAESYGSGATLTSSTGASVGALNYNHTAVPISLEGRAHIADLGDSWALFGSYVIDYQSYGIQSSNISVHTLDLMPMIGMSMRGPYRFWYSVAVGGAYNSVSPSSYAGGGVNVTVDSSKISFAYGPRLGFDADVTSVLSVGFQAALVSTKFTLGGTAASGGFSAPLSAAVSMTSLMLEPRISVRF